MKIGTTFSLLTTHKPGLFVTVVILVLPRQRPHQSARGTVLPVVSIVVAEVSVVKRVYRQSRATAHYIWNNTTLTSNTGVQPSGHGSQYVL